jgi:hypothetical protein
MESICNHDQAVDFVRKIRMNNSGRIQIPVIIHRIIAGSIRFLILIRQQKFSEDI